jgi:hypothetical protein
MGWKVTVLSDHYELQLDYFVRQTMPTLRSRFVLHLAQNAVWAAWARCPSPERIAV